MQYFSKFYDRGEDWYLAYFPLNLRGRLERARRGVRPAVGEASATYLFHPRAPERVHRFDPAMKLIVAVRDPVDRAHSHYQMEHRWGREPLSFEQALEREEAELGPELARIWPTPGTTRRTASTARMSPGAATPTRSSTGSNTSRGEQLLVVTSDDCSMIPPA